MKSIYLKAYTKYQGQTMLEAVLQLSGRFLDSVWNVSGGCLDSVLKVSRRRLAGIWKVVGRHLEGIKFGQCKLEQVK